MEPATESQTDAGQVTPLMEGEIENSLEMEQSGQAIASNSSLDVNSSDSQRVPEYLQDLYERSTQNKTDGEKKAIGNLLLQFQQVFSKDDNDLGRTHLVEHEIDTGDSKPIKIPPRRMPLEWNGIDFV